MAEAADLPPHLNYLWSAYVTLKNAAGGTVTFEQIRAYTELTGEAFDPWEVGALRAVDDAHAEEQAKLWQKK